MTRDDERRSIDPKEDVMKTEKITNQISIAYTRMTQVWHQPALPPDTDEWFAPVVYATEWQREEDAKTYTIGCPTYSDRPALIFAVEGARALCGSEPNPWTRRVAATLLRMAADETDRLAAAEEKKIEQAQPMRRSR